VRQVDKFCEWWHGEEKNAASGGGARSQSPRTGTWQITELIYRDCGWYTKLNCPTLLEKELTSQSCRCGVTQLPPGEKSNRSDHLGQSGSEQSQTSIATCPVGRRNQILFSSQSSGETTSELPPVPDSPSDQGKGD
jgi:hypothetical protein